MDITREELAALLRSGGLKVAITGATCIHCGVMFDSTEEAAAHDAGCPSHPMAAEVERLRQQLATAENRVVVLDAAVEAANKVADLSSGREFDVVMENSRLAGQVHRLRETLSIARHWFNSYARHHEAKGDMEKAQRNRDLADEMSCVRAATDPGPGVKP